VDLLVWPEVPHGISWGEVCAAIRALRTSVSVAIVPLRRDKVVGSSLQVEVGLPEAGLSPDLAELFITGPVGPADSLTVRKSDLNKCGRCWRHLPEVVEDGDRCDRCEGVVNG
jgi:isoleucyl-tRNA synthetase